MAGSIRAGYAISTDSFNPVSQVAPEKSFIPAVIVLLWRWQLSNLCWIQVLFGLFWNCLKVFKNTQSCTISSYIITPDEKKSKVAHCIIWVDTASVVFFLFLSWRCNVLISNQWNSCVSPVPVIKHRPVTSINPFRSQHCMLAYVVEIMLEPLGSSLR